MTCPNCGSCQFESNLIEEAPYVMAAQSAPQLRYFGQSSDAAHVLSALSIVRIANFLRPRWRCTLCEAKFDE